MKMEQCFHPNGVYLSVTLNEEVITPRIAKTILKRIREECARLNCAKVLLNELSVEKREIRNHELRVISEYIPGVRMAFVCRPELIDKQSRLLGAFTFATEYKVRHFSSEPQALDWLLN